MDYFNSFQFRYSPAFNYHKSYFYMSKREKIKMIDRRDKKDIERLQDLYYNAFVHLHDLYNAKSKGKDTFPLKDLNPLQGTKERDKEITKGLADKYPILYELIVRVFTSAVEYTYREIYTERRARMLRTPTEVHDYYDSLVDDDCLSDVVKYVDSDSHFNENINVFIDCAYAEVGIFNPYKDKPFVKLLSFGKRVELPPLDKFVKDLPRPCKVFLLSRMTALLEGELTDEETILKVGEQCQHYRLHLKHTKA